MTENNLEKLKTLTQELTDLDKQVREGLAPLGLKRDDLTTYALFKGQEGLLAQEFGEKTELVQAIAKYQGDDGIAALKIRRDETAYILVDKVVEELKSMYETYTSKELTEYTGPFDFGDLDEEQCKIVVDAVSALQDKELVTEQYDDFDEICTKLFRQMDFESTGEKAERAFGDFVWRMRTRFKDNVLEQVGVEAHPAQD